MEKIEVFINEAAYEKSLEYMNDSLEMQRFNFYKQKVHAFQYATRKETDTHVYWSFTDCRPRFENNRLFYSRTNKYGATYDRSKKDLKLWFGRTIQETPSSLLCDILIYFKIDWYNHMSSSLQSLLNPTMLKKIVKGKITNPRDFVKAYLKTSPYRKMDVSPELFYKVFSNSSINSAKYYRRILEYSTNINQAIELVSTLGYNTPHIVNDLFDQAAVLNRKVNPKWSEARRKEVHAQWTREIMEIEVKSIEAFDYQYPPIDLPKGFQIIQNNYELFEEGTTMKHCVYTNYEFKIRNKKYFAFRFEKDGVRATLGVDVNYFENKAVFNQMYGIGNSRIADEYVESAKEFINSDYFQDWCKKQVVNNSKESLPVDDLMWL
jgi:hypothetical protein